MTTRTDIVILGPGKVGTALGILARKAGWTVRAAGGRDVRRTRLAAERIGPEVESLPLAEAASQADLVLLCVPDDVIAPVAADLAAGECFRKGATVAHCSGALPGAVLAPARNCGCSVASFHPLQTFPTVDAAISRLGRARVFIEGDDTACRLLSALGESIAAGVSRIPTGGKAMYHASAVMASNYLVSLEHAALEMMQEAGIDRTAAWQALTPLVEATLSNIGELGTAKALTGPIARGDADTVGRHLAALARRPGLMSLYAAAGMATVELAQQARKIDDVVADKLREFLQQKMGRE